MENNGSNPYDAVLADLKAKREEIDAAISTIEKVMGVSSGLSQAHLNKGASAAVANIQLDTFFGLSILDASKKLLEIKKKPLKAAEIADDLGNGGIRFATDTPENTVASILSRHVNSDASEIVRVGRGLFGLSKWYPNSGRFKQFSTKKSQQNQYVSSDEIQVESNEAEVDPLA